MGPFGDQSSVDLVERLSRWSLSQHDVPYDIHLERELAQDTVIITPENTFNTLKSPLQELQKNDQENISAFTIWDRRWFGLILHSAAVGIVCTALPQCVYPFLTCNLNMEGAQTLSARTLLGMPWALKPVFSLFIHCSPFSSGFRLRAAMEIGWIMTAAAFIAIYFQDQPTPYFQDRTMIGIPLDEMSTQQISKINLDAPSHGAFYVMMMSLASLGYVLADVAADELIRDVATRYFGASESPFCSDDAFQATVTKYRVVATLVCFTFMGLGMSGWDYGGEFDFTLEFTQVMLLMGLVSLVPVILLVFTTSEPPRERRSLYQSLCEIWAFMKNCGLNHVFLCQFMGSMLAGVSATAVNPVAFYYAGVQPLNDSVVSVVAIIVVLMALKWVGKKGWKVNYRAVIVISTMMVLVLDLGATMLTIWGIVRSQWLWIGLPVMDAIPSSLNYTITTIVLAQVVDPDAHATVSGLVMAVSSLAGPMGLAMSKLIDAQFNVTNQDIMNDATDVRSQIMSTFLIAYAMRLGSLLWLLGLPRYASEAHAINACSSSSAGRASFLLALLSFSLVFVVVIHALSLYTPTACLVLVGGKGC